MGFAELTWVGLGAMAEPNFVVFASFFFVNAQSSEILEKLLAPRTIFLKTYKENNMCSDRCGSAMRRVILTVTPSSPIGLSSDEFLMTYPTS